MRKENSASKILEMFRIEKETPVVVTTSRPVNQRWTKTLSELATLYKTSSADIDVTNFCGEFLPDFYHNMEPDLCGQVEEATRNQNLSYEWHRQRQYRITGTKVHAVRRRQLRIERSATTIDNSALLRQIRKLGRPCTPAAKSLKRSIDHEEDALAEY
jgi:hypothetical protein